MHELFKPWENKIFSNDKQTRKKILELLGESDECENFKNREILQRDKLVE